MVLSTTEMTVQSRITREFVATDPETVTMERRQRVRNENTGAWEWQERVPQASPVVVRLLPNTFSDSPIPEVSTAGGEEPWPLYTLLAEPGVDIKRNDVFNWRGRDYRIDEIHQKPDWEFRADVMPYA